MGMLECCDDGGQAHLVATALELLAEGGGEGGVHKANAGLARHLLPCQLAHRRFLLWLGGTLPAQRHCARSQRQVAPCPVCANQWTLALK